MIDAAADRDLRRAETARANLLDDIREIKKMGDKMIEKTETAMHKAPVLVGVGFFGVALVGVAVLASRRKPAPLFGSASRERSFLAQAVRGAALSALGVLSGRITQHLLTSALAEPSAAE
jgi:hypothetical protein